MPPASDKSEVVLQPTAPSTIGQMIRAFGADDVALPGSSSENYVFRWSPTKKEKNAALQMAAEKRKLAEQETENATNGEQVATTLVGTAQNARTFADKIRQL
jgi:hypothetical protein